MEDIQSLLEKINREGIEKAEAEAKKIIAAAEAKAAAIVKAAEETAAKAKTEAEAAAEDYASRSRETIREAARDTVLGVKAEITAMLEKLLAKDVEKALAEPAAAKALTMKAISELVAGEIVCGKELARTLEAELAASGKFTVVTDESAQAGFTVKIDGGRVEHSFTAETIAAELAKHLRSDLAELVK